MSHQVSALLLAAGRSRRMGRSKQLLPLGDQPVICRCLEPLKAAGVAEILVVLGPGSEAIAPLLSDQPVRLVDNPDPESDMAGSVRVGLQQLSPATTGVLVCLVDHPLVTTASLKTLLQEHDQTPDRILIPTYRGKKGHPSLFPRTIIKELFREPTLRHLVRHDPGRLLLIEVPDPGVVEDMDTPEDYHRVLALWEDGRKSPWQVKESSAGQSKTP